MRKLLLVIAIMLFLAPMFVSCEKAELAKPESISVPAEKKVH